MNEVKPLSLMQVHADHSMQDANPKHSRHQGPSRASRTPFLHKRLYQSNVGTTACHQTPQRSSTCISVLAAKPPPNPQPSPGATSPTRASRHSRISAAQDKPHAAPMHANKHPCKEQSRYSQQASSWKTLPTIPVHARAWADSNVMQPTRAPASQSTTDEMHRLSHACISQCSKQLQNITQPHRVRISGYQASKRETTPKQASLQCQNPLQSQNHASHFSSLALCAVNIQPCITVHSTKAHLVFQDAVRAKCHASLTDAY